MLTGTAPPRKDNSCLKPPIALGRELAFQASAIGAAPGPRGPYLLY